MFEKMEEDGEPESQAALQEIVSHLQSRKHVSSHCISGKIFCEKNGLSIEVRNMRKNIYEDAKHSL